MIWVGMAALLVGALLLTYLGHLPSAINVLIWILWLATTIVLGYFTEKGKQVYEFGQESYIELKKVTWPTRQETIQTTLIVMAVVAITGFVLWGVDSGMMWIIGKITLLG